MRLTTGAPALTGGLVDVARDGGPGLPAGGGAMGALIRAYDWAATPLGPSESWSPSLRMMVSMLLANRFPLLLWWGPDYISIYNDAYRPVLGAKHPQALGLPCCECWAEIWHVLRPLIDSPFQGGPATWMEDLALEVRRHGFAEESHFTVAYSPVPDETAPRGIGGVLATVHEITEKIIGERRIAALSELGARTAQAKSAQEACLAAAAMLAESARDVPFALIYLLEDEGRAARLMAAAGFPEGEVAPAGLVRLAGEESRACPWPLAEAVRTEATVTLEDLPARLARVPPGPWSDPPQSAVVIPIRSTTAHQLAGLLVAGVSSRLRLNEQYHGFFGLVAAQIATAIANTRAYEEERKRAEALAEIDRAKTAFFSNVSHEFRTPLTLMLGPLEDAAADPATPARVRAQLDVAQRNALRLQKLVNTLLDFSRIEAGRVQASYEPVDLAAVTSDLASNFRSAIERAGLVLEVDCPPLAEPVYVDLEMWEKIVLNLLSNAFKFTFRGTIAVRLRREDGGAVLEVADTGLGIAEDELARVFERFHRIEGVVGRTLEGSGIGLALVQELVKLHGGTISVASQVQRGTTFRVAVRLGTDHLPAGRIKGRRTLGSTAIGARAFVEEALRWIPQADGAPGLPLLGEDDPAPPLAGRFDAADGARILLADDNADMRTYLRDLLSRAYSVEAVTHGEEALAAARRRRPDLILADVMMPGLDGLELLRALRADDSLRDVPVILLSARAGEEARLEALQAGADDYLVKPFSARELVARVGARLELLRMRRETERTLREREEQLRLATEAAEVGLWDLDLTTDTLYWPPRVKAMFGISPDAPVSMADFYSGLHPADRQHTSEAFAAACDPQRRALYDVEYRTVGKEDGRLRWVAAKGRGIFAAGGRCVRVLGTAIDITARKSIEAALDEANRRKDEFLAMLAHELRNPLAPIGNASELLARIIVDDSRAETAVQMIKRQVAQLTRLVDDLLDVSRITQGRVELRREPVELATVLAQAVETVGALVRVKRHELSVVSHYEPLYVDGDLVRLVQCVGNLLANAAKYTDPGGKIRVQTRAEDAQAVIEVTDNGAGIGPELLPRVFDLFVQSDRTLDRAQGGLGIGLSIVKRLTEMHAGQVTAHSPGPGLGSTFAIRLPRIARPEVMPETGAIRAPPQRILIVDDNADSAHSLALLLTLSGHTTRVALSSEEALAGAVSFEPQVALLDIGLPRMNGYELARRLRRAPNLAAVRLIALTGYGQTEDRERALAAGFDDHLIKPVDLSALERALTSRSSAS
jgi:PAS domain S-box-containing protein